MHIATAFPTKTNPCKKHAAACAKRKIRVHYPELHLCTDNGAMIAMAAAMRIQAGREQALHEYAFDVKPRWPLDSLR